MAWKSLWIKAEFSFCSPLFIHLFSTYYPHVFLIFLHFFFHIVWIIFIKYQYKKYRNIFFYVFSLFLSIDVLSMWYCLPDSSYCLARHVQNLSLITRMRRICSFHGFFCLDYFFLSDLSAPVGCWDFHGFTLVCGLSADFSCYRQSSAVQAQIQSEWNPRPSKSKNKKKSVKKIKSVASELSVSYFERVRTEPKAKEQFTNS